MFFSLFRVVSRFLKEPKARNKDSQKLSDHGAQHNDASPIKAAMPRSRPTTHGEVLSNASVLLVEPTGFHFFFKCSLVFLAFTCEWDQMFDEMVVSFLGTKTTTLLPVYCFFCLIFSISLIFTIGYRLGVSVSTYGFVLSLCLRKCF